MGLSADGKRILVLGRTLRNGPRREQVLLTAWDLANGKSLFRRVDPSGSKYQWAAIAPDGQSIALAEEGGLVLRDAGSGKEILTLPIPANRGYPAGFSDDGKLRPPSELAYPLLNGGR
jgi:hypothetical protein